MKQKASSELVYIVDDQAIIAGSLAAILERDGFRVMKFSDPQSALSRARYDPPRLLLSEAFLSSMSGIDLAIAMSYAAPDCRLLLFSESSRVQMLLERTRQRGFCFEFISKPFKFSELLAKCRHLLMGPAAGFAESALPGIPFG